MTKSCSLYGKWSPAMQGANSLRNCTANANKMLLSFKLAMMQWQLSCTHLIKSSFWKAHCTQNVSYKTVRYAAGKAPPPTSAKFSTVHVFLPQATIHHFYNPWRLNNGHHLTYLFLLRSLPVTWGMSFKQPLHCPHSHIYILVIQWWISVG